MTDKPVGAIAFFTLNRHALPIQMPPVRQPPFRNTHLYFLFWLHPFLQIITLLQETFSSLSSPIRFRAA
jgi:hypothetical protein